MKTHSRPARSHGAALVIVLSFLVIIIVLILAIAASSVTERRASSASDTTFNTELLASLVENLTQTQIREATTQPVTIAWASQPGMIRTFNTDGSLNTAYKLYSGQNHQISNQAALDLELNGYAATTADFTNRPATYADLNKPVIFKDKVSYPIADPRALGKVDGFLYNGATNAPTTAFTVNGVFTNVPVIPMPVQWLYVLRDGQIIAPDRTSENNKIIAIPGASSTNPIVGRIAYWADDDSSKLNINTAADGTYWDTPRTSRNSPEENFSKFQPARNEFQSYQGHPATTSLRPVFASYLGLSGPALREKLIELSPRYQIGGSLGVTVTPTAKLDLSQKQTHPFYTSTDEYQFDSNNLPTTARTKRSIPHTDTLEQTRFFLTANSRAPEVNLFNMPRVSLWPIRSINDSNNRTINDRLNLFCSTLGTTGNNTYAFTRTSAEATDGEFTGDNSRNLVLYNYLNALMKKPVPGFSTGNTFSSKYGDDQPQILTQIYDFIRSVNIADKSMLNNATFKNFTAINDKNVGLGQVAPTDFKIDGVNTKGFARFITMSEAAITIVGQKVADSGNPAITKYNARAAFLVELASLAQGPSRHWINFKVTVTGLNNLEVSPKNDGNFVNMGFPPSATYWPYQTPSNALFGGSLGLLTSMNIFLNQGSYPNTQSYPFVSDPAGFTFTTDEIKYDFVDLVSPNLPTPQPSPTEVWYSWPAFGGPKKITGSWNSQEPTPQFAIRQNGPISVTLSIGTTSNATQTIFLEFPSFTSYYPTPLGPTQSGNNINPYHLKKKTDPGYFSVNAAFTDAFDAAITLAGRLGLPTKSHTQYFFPAMNDVTRSLVPLGPVSPGGRPINGDLRLVAATKDVPVTTFLPNVPAAYNSNLTPGGLSHSLSGPRFFYGNWVASQNGNGQVGRLVKDKTFLYGNNPNTGSFSDIPLLDASGATVNGVKNALGQPGDFDTGVSFHQDGPWINKPDEGDELNMFNSGALSGNPPYYKTDETTAVGDSFFSPNRQIASPVQLGSLPTGVKASKPWQTLLFSPNPAAVTTSGEMFSANAHPGFAAPRDHLLLDLFWIPVVEPYAISDPFSTAGKINLNHELAPFSDSIRRDTALRGVLLSTKISAIPLAHSDRFKVGEYPGPYAGTTNYRYPIDMDRTLAEIDRRFSAPGGMYISPTEICDVFLIPRKDTENPIPTLNLSQANIIASFWNANTVTGDNLRERPYNSLYPRLTTKSNVFTVHYTVQALKKVLATDAGVWDETKDKVLGEQRGAITLERYIDPRDPEFDLPAYDFAAQVSSGTPPTLGRFYKFRTVSTRQFRQ